MKELQTAPYVSFDPQYGRDIIPTRVNGFSRATEMSFNLFTKNRRTALVHKVNINNSITGNNQ